MTELTDRSDHADVYVLGKTAD